MTVSRRAFLGLAGGAAAATAGCGKTERQKAGRGPQPGDADSVRFALTLEYVERDFYDQVLQAGVLSGAEAQLAHRFAEDERKHVAALEGVARRLRLSVPVPETAFDAVLGSREKILKTAALLENGGADAYLGQLSEITSDDVLASVLAIHTVEARHAAAISRILGRSSEPDGAFATSLDADEAMRRLEPYLV